MNEFLNWSRGKEGRRRRRDASICHVTTVVLKSIANVSNLQKNGLFPRGGPRRKVKRSPRENESQGIAVNAMEAPTRQHLRAQRRQQRRYRMISNVMTKRPLHFHSNQQVFLNTSIYLAKYERNILGQRHNSSTYKLGGIGKEMER